MLRILFNYYMVLKTCWIVLLFQLIGYLAVVEFEQGRDIVASLDLIGPGARTGFFALIGVLWWSWQSWRAARAELHLSSFHFKQLSSRVAIQAQVMVPRVLGLIPLLIMGASLFRSNAWDNPMIYVVISLMVWVYVFFYFRQQINIWLKAKYATLSMHLPDYILVKNEAYPASFLWVKQWRWLLFRTLWIALVFALVLLWPISYPQWVGSAALVFFALGAWQVLATFLDFAQRYLHLPLSFMLIACFILFSLINNNHEIRTLDGPAVERLDLHAHFDRWMQIQEPQDTTTVVLVAAQGGGLRSAYWTASVLSQLNDSLPAFDQSVYAFSAVSGGALGVSTYTDLGGQSSKIRPRLGRDFLSPVTAFLIFPEVVQRLFRAGGK
jgi:hypothetical protein